jgi:membrane fusion protein, heavy metal efflux system
MASKKSAIAAAAIIAVAVAAYLGRDAIVRNLGFDGTAATSLKSATPTPSEAQQITLSAKQAEAVKVEPVEERLFPTEKEAVGSIDFNEDMLVQVFAPYQGRIIRAFVKIGDEVKKDQTLFTIDSPDLVQAVSTLISAAGVLELTTLNLARQRDLIKTKAAAQRDLEQAISDQQAAEAGYKAARDAVRIFGKTDAEMDRMVKDRHVDPALVVPCPIDGRITARNAAPGLLVQPGNPPPPYIVADISTMWMLANVMESDSPAFRVGQEVKVRVLAYPDRTFGGRITTVGATVDPNTHRQLIRSEIDDPEHLLRSGMFATFVIETGQAVRSAAVPLPSVVREGDGTMTVWVTTDNHLFTRRIVTIGKQRDGYRQILEGLHPGDVVATEGAVFLSNMLAIARS